MQDPNDLHRVGKIEVGLGNVPNDKQETNCTAVITGLTGFFVAILFLIWYFGS